MIKKDPWHYPRIDLAHSIITTLSSNIVHALTLFAPRRMGKTEFLTKDITPTAENADFRVFYFSFLDGFSGDVVARFTHALSRFVADTNLLSKSTDKAKNIKSVGAAGFSLELREQQPESISDLLNALALAGQPVLLLLDEIQELSNIPKAAGVIGSLRTGLDLNRETIKTIFTGSSRNGLQSMFSDSRAPFFHFSTSLDFPTLDDGFVLHLAAIYKSITGETINEVTLIDAFNQLGRVPMHLRNLIKDVILDPAHELTAALAKLKSTIETTQDYSGVWHSLKGLDKAIIQRMAHGGTEPYSTDARAIYAGMVGVKSIGMATVQSAIRRLIRQNHLTKNALGDYVLSEPNFLQWVQEQQ